MASSKPSTDARKEYVDHAAEAKESEAQRLLGILKYAHESLGVQEYEIHYNYVGKYHVMYFPLGTHSSALMLKLRSASFVCARDQERKIIIVQLSYRHDFLRYGDEHEA